MGKIKFWFISSFQKKKQRSLTIMGGGIHIKVPEEKEDSITSWISINRNYYKDYILSRLAQLDHVIMRLRVPNEVCKKYFSGRNKLALINSEPKPPSASLFYYNSVFYETAVNTRSFLNSSSVFP